MTPQRRHWCGTVTEVKGPGITSDGSQRNTKVSVELGTNPGLEFDAAGDAGKLKVKVNGRRQHHS